MISWADAVAAWLLSMKATGCPSTTLGTRSYQLRRLAADLEPVRPGEVTEATLVAWLGAPDWARETRRSFRSALRSFFRWLHGAGHIEVDPALGLEKVRASVPSPRPAPEDAYRLALAHADDRVRLMLRLAAELGMRRCEVAVARGDDLERDLTGWSLRVHGKGEKIRTVPIGDALAIAIRRSARRDGYLFPGNDNGHLSARYVGKLVARALPAAWAMHSLRHRFATVAYSHDRDLLSVQELLGHASPDTTRRYVLLPAARLRATVEAVAAV